MSDSSSFLVQQPNAGQGRFILLVGRTPLDEGSVSRRDLYLTTTLTKYRQPCPQQESKPKSQKASSLISLGHWDVHEWLFSQVNSSSWHTCNLYSESNTLFSYNGYILTSSVSEMSKCKKRLISKVGRQPLVGYKLLIMSRTKWQTDTVADKVGATVTTQNTTGWGWRFRPSKKQTGINWVREWAIKHQRQVLVSGARDIHFPVNRFST
jgi:hypothetical protein